MAHRLTKAQLDELKELLQNDTTIRDDITSFAPHVLWRFTDDTELLSDLQCVCVKGKGLDEIDKFLAQNPLYKHLFWRSVQCILAKYGLACLSKCGAADVATAISAFNDPELATLRMDQTIIFSLRDRLRKDPSFFRLCVRLTRLLEIGIGLNEVLAEMPTETFYYRRRQLQLLNNAVRRGDSVRAALAASLRGKMAPRWSVDPELIVLALIDDDWALAKTLAANGHCQLTDLPHLVTRVVEAVCKAETKTAVEGADELAVLDALADAGCNISREFNGKTPLLIAVEAGRVDIVERLLRKGADPDVRPGAGKYTALDVARDKKRSDIANLLRAAAKPNSRTTEACSIM